jgi:hypothetical protein
MNPGLTEADNNREENNNYSKKALDFIIFDRNKYLCLLSLE